MQSGQSASNAGWNFGIGRGTDASFGSNAAVARFLRPRRCKKSRGVQRVTAVEHLTLAIGDGAIEGRCSLSTEAGTVLRASPVLRIAGTAEKGVDGLGR